MIDYWSRFVTNGVPQAAGQPDWPALGADVAAQPWMSLQPDGSRVVTTFDESHQCPFWANLHVVAERAKFGKRPISSAG